MNTISVDQRGTAPGSSIGQGNMRGALAFLCFNSRGKNLLRSDAAALKKSILLLSFSDLSSG